MISHELATKLKESGFPQMIPGETGQSYNKEGRIVTYDTEKGAWPDGTMCYIPSKRELVQALGDDLESIMASAFLKKRELEDAGEDGKDPFQ